uniref:Uncharacterized protein n=1 Tax=Oryza sativa subsp. japonica TaxID=39947 RepID=Q5Z948_ORYSJ|nr:hypothetical protein [Oryza sativa Japonica Group]
MPPEVHAQFAAAEGGHGFECAAHGDYVVLAPRGPVARAPTSALVFDSRRNEWWWALLCPYVVVAHHGSAGGTGGRRGGDDTTTVRRQSEQVEWEPSHMSRTRRGSRAAPGEEPSLIVLLELREAHRVLDTVVLLLLRSRRRHAATVHRDRQRPQHLWVNPSSPSTVPAAPRVPPLRPPPPTPAGEK